MVDSSAGKSVQQNGSSLGAKCSQWAYQGCSFCEGDPNKSSNWLATDSKNCYFQEGISSAVPPQEMLPAIVLKAVRLNMHQRLINASNSALAKLLFRGAFDR